MIQLPVLQKREGAEMKKKRPAFAVDLRGKTFLKEKNKGATLSH